MTFPTATALSLFMALQSAQKHNPPHHAWTPKQKKPGNVPWPKPKPKPEPKPKPKPEHKNPSEKNKESHRQHREGQSQHARTL